MLVSTLGLFLRDNETKYDAVYSYDSTIGKEEVKTSGNTYIYVKQKLFIRNIDKTSFEFKLIIERQVCNYEISGIATTEAKTDMLYDQYVDENSNETFDIIEYRFSNDNIKLVVLMSTEKDKVVVGFKTIGDPNKICPSEGQIMNIES
jgi:hypothetical protein